ncbi:MAG: mechanosensitive ion channel family protein [Actinobacteria bacterium]|nr:mechanosensitive ion channel family protein [Actinomycetota bacterium]
MAVIAAVAVLVSLLARLGVRRLERRLAGSADPAAEPNLRRTATLAHTLSSAVGVVIWTMALLLVLDQFGVNLAPLLAGAGIVGVALGFGAQSLVRDFLSGFFILLENQFGVGDIVQALTSAGQVTGKVEALTLRITSIRSFDGTLHVIPNGNIQVVGNKTREWARAIVDVSVAYGEEVDRVAGILEELFGELREDEGLASAFIDGPRLLGVDQLADFSVVMRVVAEVHPARKFEIERELRARIKQRFDERGIEIPFPPYVGRREGGGPPAPTT